jgi:hypothetical protein
MYVYVNNHNGQEALQNNGHRVNGYYIEVRPKDKRIIINLDAGNPSSSMTKIEMGRDEAIKLVSKLLSVL